MYQSAYQGRTSRIQLVSKWKPTQILVEDRASGQSLIQELRHSTCLPIIPIKGITVVLWAIGHTEAQMIGALKQLKAGYKAEDVAREVACRTTQSTLGTRSTAGWT